MRKILVAVLGVAPWLAVGCGDDLPTMRNLSGGAGAGGADSKGIAGSDSGAGGAGGTVAGSGGTGAGGSGGTGTITSARGCSDLFDPAILADYAVDISADEWAKMDYEFHNRDALEAAGVDYKTYHPVVFHYGSETVSDAMIRLKGQSSWRHAVLLDGDKAKMQFVISFEQVNPEAKFHGVSKVVLDMPDNDETFMQERMGFNALAEVLGLPAPCANSGRISFNGQYYGVYVNEENVGHGFLKRVFPEAPDGDLFEGGWTAKTNELMPNTTRLEAFWDAHDIGAMATIVDMDDSIAEWAAEALMNDGDGYWGGGHNFYIYDYRGKGYRWMIDDADATFAWLGRSDLSPIYWWAGRTTMQKPGQHYLIVMGDPTWRGKYIAVLRQLLARWDVARLQGWIDTWSAQIADSVAQDPHLLISVADHNGAVQAMRQEVADRPAYVAKFLGCEDGSGDVTDKDGDGFAWCNDCDDGNPAVSPGAVEICGNGIDDNCNRFADTEDGCPAM
jgi:Putative metal-binding motif/CotH kinase protein